MAQGIRAANPIWYFVDLVGLGLNDQYYMHFLTNTFPYLPQPVYHDVNLTIPWSNPLIFYPNGTLPDDMYWDPNLVWRLEVRRGPLQSDPLIYEINNFQPGQGGITPNNLDIVTASNQITNPQFSETFFTNDYVITTAGTYNIAPGWDLIITGTGGTTTLTQLVLSGADSAGSPIIVGNPPFALRINNSGWTTVTLEQRFNNNGALWQNGAVAGVILARANTSSQTISMNYVESDGGRFKQIFTHLFTTANFQFFGGAVDIDNIPVASNTDPSTVAYTNIDIILPPNGSVDISNVQITGQTQPLPTDFDQTTDLPSYDQETIERNIDHQFHVYQESLLHQNKINLLTGWIFGLNPWQFRTTTITNVANNTYTADQTIIVQQAYVTSATANNVAVGRGTNAENFAFVVQAVTATNKFAAIQYIDPATIRPYWGKIVSSLVNATNSSPTHSTDVQFKMRLIYRASLPSTIAQNEPIASWSNVDGSNPVFSAGWTEIIPMNDPEHTISANGGGDFSFNQFQLPASSNDAMTLGIVIYTTNNMNQAATADRVLFNTVSLVHNDFAIEASSETFDESLRKCQYYFESSYESPAQPGDNPQGNGASYQPQLAGANGGGNTAARPKSFQLAYRAVKRAHPVITIYSPTTGASNVTDVYLYNGGALAASIQVTFSANWSLLNNSCNYEALYQPASFTALLNPGVVATLPESFLSFQYTLDSRLGI